MTYRYIEIEDTPPGAERKTGLNGTLPLHRDADQWLRHIAGTTGALPGL
jgi:hypothetical protein